MKRGTIHIYSGDGHGKTPAALGRAVSVACCGKSVVIIQFLKGKGLEESEFLRRLEPEIKLFRVEKSGKILRSLQRNRRKKKPVILKTG